MKNIIKCVLLIAAMGVLFASCSNEDNDPEPVPEEKVDVREPAVGGYLGSIDFRGSGTVFSDQSISVTIGSSEDALNVFWDGANIKGTNVISTSSGFTFDVEPFSIRQYSYTGYRGIDSKYHGAFNADEGELIMYLEQSFQGSLSGIVKFTLQKIQ